MATNNAISFNQLKKSVFNMKNYNDQSIQEIYNNINRPYIENNEKIIKLQTKVNDDGKLDKTGFSTSRDNATGILGNQVIMNYDDSNLYNIMTNSLNKIHVIMKLDGNIIIDKIVYTSNSSVSNYYYPEKPEGFDGAYYFRVIISKDKICNSGGNFENAKGKFYVSVVYAHAEALVDFLKGNIEVEIHGLERNKNNITSIYGLQEISKAKYTLGVDYDYTDKYVGNCSINFGNSDVPSYSYITGLNDFGIKDGTYTYPATSNYLSIFGYHNKFKMIKHGFIAGYNNVLDAYYTGAGIQGCLCIGRNNNFTEERANRDYYIGIIGQNIKAVQSGLFVGVYGTIPSTEIFAICNGTTKEDKTLLSVNRNTGAVTSISTPTENNHLTTKKYVDDKVAGIVNSAPETLDTLQELATALGNDPNFATTVSTQIGKKVNKVDGMSLTHNDLTNELKANYDAAYAYSQAKHSYNDLTDKPTIPDVSSYAPITSPVFKKSISIGNVAPDKTLGENSIIVSSYGEASGVYTLSNGKSSIARADYSHAEGYASMSKGIYSHAEGEQTGAIAQSSHSEGHGGYANGVASHAEGYYTTSNGQYSHAEGYRTIATGDNQHVQGKYNIEDKDNKYAHIVGNGYRDERNYKDYRSNGYTLDWSGNGWFAGKVTQEGTPTDDKDLTNKKYVDDNVLEATDEEVDAMLLEVLGGDYSVQS